MHRSQLFFLLFSLPQFLLAQHYINHGHPITVIAHRGDHTHAPENTMAAIDSAIRIGVDYVEIDLRTTKDSVLINHHDGNLKRMTGMDAAIKTLDFAQIQALRVKDKDHPEWGEHAIPTFEKILKRCKGKVGIYLDFKDASVAQAYRMIKAAKMQRSIVVYVYDDKTLAEWQRVAPKIPTMMSLPKTVKDVATLRDFLNKNSVNILDGPYNVYDKEMVKTALEFKRQVWADIQNPFESKMWAAALATGLQGLQTDHPGDLLRFLATLSQ
jgi:glycerophosphoryl diester phosphodiesterase